jgi:RNA polymerase I-specific transcription initiation factor RRN5
METEDPENVQSGFPILDEDSGSAYEEESEAEEQGSSQDEQPQVERSSRASSATRQRRSQSRGRRGRDPSPYQHRSESEGPKSRDSSTASQKEERRRAASEWAATFQEPQSPSDVKTISRRDRRTKRKAVKTPTQIRAKRLKSWYNNEYRELLNIDIHDAVARSVAEYREPLVTSQIGCSIWTGEEKDLFFSALSRLGRDNVRDIASRIETKSETEVQEYIQLLHEGMMQSSNERNKLLGTTDLPAAIEISEECCGVLERAGDALAARQELAEEEVEEAKWDDLWLLSSDVNKLLKRDFDRKDVKGKLPAVDLFVLGNWLELSRRVFMNSNNEDDNWEHIAEPDEEPAIRATAFEDFHSLAVSVTKRLLSTTLFCTMSRQRAMASNPIKRADVNEDDVWTATKILGLKTDSKDFWIRCARRCNLKVFDEEWNSFMSYEEAEKSLGETPRERSRSRSVSRRSRSVSRARSDVQKVQTDSESYSSEDYGSDESMPSQESGASDGELKDYLPEGGMTTSKSTKEHLLQKAKAKMEAEFSQEAYIEAFDQKQSRFKEQQLWTLLGQTAPFEIKSEPMGLPDPPKGDFRDDLMERGNWRKYVDFRSQWETLETPVPTAHFDRNRKRVSKRARRRMERASAQRNGDSADSEDVEPDDEEVPRDVVQHESEEQDGEAEEEERDEYHLDAREEIEEAPMNLDEDENDAYDSAQNDFEDQVEDAVHDTLHNRFGTEYHEQVDDQWSDYGGDHREDQLPGTPSVVSENSRGFQTPTEDDTRIKSEYESP